MKINLDRLNLRAELLQPIVTRNPATGEALTSFLAIATRWCGLLSLLPSEVQLQEQLSERATIKIVLRLDGLARTVTPEWRVRIGGSDYEITGLDANLHDRSLLVYLKGPPHVR